MLTKWLQDNPIVVTGLGCISAAGDSVDALWRASLAARGLATWREFPVADQSPQRFAVCSAPPLDTSAPELRSVRKSDRCAQMALQAAVQAVKQSAINGTYAPERIGVFIGSSRGPLGKIDESLASLQRGAIIPTLSAQTSMGSISGTLAQYFGWNGPGGVISATCASAAFAIGLAAEQILLGKADAMLVGGTEAPLHAVVLAQLQASGVLGSHADAALACRPFDATRNGMVLGEGSGFLVLESARLAARRGAQPFARLAGWSMTIDGSGRTGMQEDGSSVERAMQEALNLAQLGSRDIGYVNAHGSGTVLNDFAEAAAVNRLLRAVPCSSTKPVTGHCLGATPALAAILCIEALRHQQLPPAVNCAQPDPKCPIHLVTPGHKPAPFTSTLCNSIGFWGYHSSLIFSRA